MKIAVLSDLHLGFGYNSELENDSFENFEEALERALDSDLIIIAGDLFDSRSPRTAVWARAIKILSKAILKKSAARLVSTTKNIHDIHKKTLEAVPIVAIYGNHDRRTRNEINAVEALDYAGLLILLHKENIVFEKDGVRVAIHGMSSVPERFAKQNLEEWNPKPIEGCFNILVIHQNVYPYVYSPLEPPSISLENIPKGFDMILDGHIHMKAYEKVNEKPFIILGSTVITQFDKKEANNEKGFHFIEVGQENKIDFVPLQSSRKFFYYDVSTNNNSTLRDQIEKLINEIVFVKNLPKPPIIKFRISGKDTEVVDEDLRMIEKRYEGKAIMMFSKALESQEMTEKMEFLRNLRDQKMSVEEIGLSLLEKNLTELQFKPAFPAEEIFKTLSDGEVDKAYAILVGDQKTLLEISKAAT